AWARCTGRGREPPPPPPDAARRPLTPGVDQLARWCGRVEVRCRGAHAAPRRPRRTARPGPPVGRRRGSGRRPEGDGDSTQVDARVGERAERADPGRGDGVPARCPQHREEVGGGPGAERAGQPVRGARGPAAITQHLEQEPRDRHLQRHHHVPEHVPAGPPRAQARGGQLGVGPAAQRSARVIRSAAVGPCTSSLTPERARSTAAPPAATAPRARRDRPHRGSHEHRRRLPIAA
ncbi:MAG: hypothetical protein JWQ53_1526, partial [Klenkia sp.]|nr:hypothetical protein [Klenkia sp.]